MQISNSFNSHPKKSYNFHVKNISDSFDESDHKETASFHDIAKIAQRFQDYINLEVENFASKEDFEKAQQKLKTTHTLESAFIYFFIYDSSLDIINFSFCINWVYSIGEIKAVLFCTMNFKSLIINVFDKSNPFDFSLSVKIAY